VSCYFKFIQKLNK